MRDERDPASAKGAGLFHKTDTAVAAIVIVIAAGLWVATATFEDVPNLLAQNVGPAVFPRLVLVALVLLTLALPVEHRFVRGGRARIDSERSRPIAGRTWLAAGLLIGIGAAMPFAGTLLTLFLVCILLPPIWGRVRPRIFVPFAIAFPVVVKVVFEDLLEVSFEPGLLAALVY